MQPSKILRTDPRDVQLRHRLPLAACRGAQGKVPREQNIVARTNGAKVKSNYVVDVHPAVAPPALPATYKRLVARRCGASFREVATVQELDLTPPGQGEVLIRVSHAGINGGCETFRARGEYAFEPNRRLQDFSLGAEGAGVVAALGPGVYGLAVGQRVAVNGAAAFAEYVMARSSFVVPVPDEVSGAEAVALVLSGTTACVALEATARVRTGEVVAVTAAAGGTGHLAVQLAVAAGATVVAIVGGLRKAEAVAALGAHHVVDYRKEDVVTTLQGLFPNGLDVVYEGVGGQLRKQLLACLAPSGRLLQVGYISEYPHVHGYSWGSGRDGGGDDSPSTSGGETPVASCRVAGSSSSPAAGAPTSAPAASKAPHATAPEATLAPCEAVAEDTAAAETPAAAAAGLVLSSAELFWGGIDQVHEQQRIIGQIWPKDLKAILRCRRRVFDLARRGQLRVITDQGHGRRGVDGVADAIDYMLRGEHVGKVVIEM